MVLRMSSEVRFTRERGGRGGRHEQASPILRRREGGGRVFFSGPPRSGGLFRQCGPVASPHRPPSVVHSVAGAGLARTTHPATGGSASGVASCGAPGLNAATGAFDFCCPRPAGSPSSTCRRRLCPDTGGPPLCPRPRPRHPDSSPRGGRDRKRRPRRHAGTNRGRGQGRSRRRPRGACRGGGVGHPVSAAPASPAQPQRPARTAPGRPGARAPR